MEAYYGAKDNPGTVFNASTASVYVSAHAKASAADPGAPTNIMSSSNPKPLGSGQWLINQTNGKAVKLY